MLSLVWLVRNLVGRPLNWSGEGEIDWGGRDSSTSEETVGEVGKAKAWGDGNRRHVVINKTELKCNLFEHKHVKKEVPAE